MVHEGFGIPASDIVVFPFGPDFSIILTADFRQLFGRSLGAAVACALASRRCVGGAW